MESPRLYWTDPALAHLPAEQAGAPDGALVEAAALDEVLRWSSCQPAEVGLALHAPDRLLAIEVEASQRAHRRRPLAKVLAARGVEREAWRLGLVVTRGREVEPLAPGVRAIPDWRLCGPAGSM